MGNSQASVDEAIQMFGLGLVGPFVCGVGVGVGVGVAVAVGVGGLAVCAMAESFGASEDFGDAGSIASTACGSLEALSVATFVELSLSVS